MTHLVVIVCGCCRVGSCGRSWDEKQRERGRLARLAMLERDNHHTDNTHMMKVQNLADDEIVGGGVRRWQAYTHTLRCPRCPAGFVCPANNVHAVL